MLFVVHATDKKDALTTRAKFYRAHRIHLDKAEDHAVGVVTAGTLVADDGESPVGSIFVVEAPGLGLFRPIRARTVPAPAAKAQRPLIGSAGSTTGAHGIRSMNAA